jgi:NAD+ diphosphatase
MPQTVYRYCPVCAAELADKVLLDGSTRPACPRDECGYVWFDSPVTVAGVIIRRGDEVLLARPHGYDNYFLVAGYLAPYETVEEAAVREAREETGLDIEVERMLGTYSCQALGQNMIIAVCLAHIVGGELALKADELADARWFPLDALPQWPPEQPLVQAFADLRRLEEGAA